MSIKLMSRVWEISPYTHTMLLIHVAMADAANDEGEFWYKQETLAKKARVSVRYLRDVTQRMEEDGWLVTNRVQWGRLTYRLLMPQEGNSVPVPPEPSSGQRGTQFRSEGNTVPVTTEPSVEPSVETSEGTTNIGPCGTEEDHMGTYGLLPEDEESSEKKPKRGPDDADLRAFGAVAKEKPAISVTEKRFKEAPKVGTHKWLVYRFGQEQRQHNCGRSFTMGILHAAFKDLRDDGYSNEDIEVMIRAFFSQNEQYIRTKMSDTDVAAMFRSRMHTLKIKTRASIRAERTGSRELSRNINKRIKEQLRRG